MLHEDNFNQIYNESNQHILFESVYNESLQKFTEINKDNFWAKINANKTGTAYAQSILQLSKIGKSTPISLSGNLKKERYIWNGNVVNGTQYFVGNASFNSFLIEKIYEELLLEKGKTSQKRLQKFFTDFKNELQKDGIAFSSLNFVDYDVVAA